MRKKQRLVAGALVLVGTSLAIVAGVFVYRNLCRNRFAENVILIEEPRPESFWTLIETKGGYLIRVRNGRFKGWYLGCDDRVNSSGIPSGATTWTRALPVRIKSGLYVRNLVLRDRVAPDCYWKITETSGGSYIQATRGRYEDWYLDFIAEYVPDIGSSPRTAWNLALNKGLVEGATWKLKRTAEGHLIEATAGPFKGWCLDSLREAKVLERNRCWGEQARKDHQTPPLAK